MNKNNKSLFRAICQITCFILMLVTSIYGFYQRLYLESIISGALTILIALKIPNSIKSYKKL
ncbi:hypothetical protein [Clostridium senegalense]|uniref:hypothetical protein n=1 Tax=Clostridium senegalense TaxID=1465809 RepID=UPI0011CABBCE|nr:hypothetical protein [Clostridium senegalense]MBU5226541.1 hypothetical protein [Clostridium senegalense]